MALRSVGGFLAPLLVMAALALSGVLSSVAVAQGDLGEHRVTVSSLNVRSGPGPNFPVQKTVKLGERAVVTARQNGWARISPLEAAPLWVAGRFLESDSRPLTAPLVPVETVALAPAAPSEIPGTAAGALDSEANLVESPTEATTENVAETAAATQATAVPPEDPASPETVSSQEPANDLDRPYDLRGFALGMSLNAFKITIHPDAARLPDTLVLCSNDRQVPADVTLPSPPENAEALGLVRCRHAHRVVADGQEAEAGASRFADSPLLLADVAMTPFFHFIRDDNGVARLFGIFLHAETRYFDPLLTALSHRLGPPISERADSIEEANGQILENREVTWTNGHSIAQLNRYWADGETLSLEYTHSGLGELFVTRYSAVAE